MSSTLLLTRASLILAVVLAVFASSGAANAQQPTTSTSEEDAWNQAALKNTCQAYLDFSAAHPDSAHIKISTGTVRGRYWVRMGDTLTLGNGVPTASKDKEGVIVTVADTDALANLTIEEAIDLGVVGSKPDAEVPSGTELKIPVTTFNVSSFELRGAGLVSYSKVSGPGETIKILLEPKDMLNARVVLSADGTRLLAWDFRNATAAEHPDTSQATYPKSARKPSSGLNPESQNATFTERKK